MQSTRAWPILALSLAVLVGAATRAYADGEDRIAVVDMKAALMQTEDGIRAQATLKKLFDRRQQEIDNRKEALKRARLDIEQQSHLLSSAALERRVAHWQSEMLELQTIFFDYNAELETKQEELTAPILKGIVVATYNMASRENFELVLDKQSVPYARSEIDKTDQVVAMYNAGDFGQGSD